MKIETKNNMIVLKEVYNTILLETEVGKQLYVCMRDGGFEISVDGKNWMMTHESTAESTASKSIDAVEVISNIFNEELKNANNIEGIPVTATPKIETWDYKGWKEYSDTETPYSQFSWNQTLMTKINQITYRNRFTELDVNVVITVPVNLIPLIKSLDYYNEETHTIGDRYDVDFIDAKSNRIVIGNIPLEIENY